MNHAKRFQAVGPVGELHSSKGLTPDQLPLLTGKVVGALMGLSFALGLFAGLILFVLFLR